jgi:hypothetical protein
MPETFDYARRPIGVIASRPLAGGKGIHNETPLTLFASS